MASFGANIGAAARGAVAGLESAQAAEARQIAIQQTRQREAAMAEAAKAQQAGLTAYRNTMLNVYGVPSTAGLPQPPMPGEASVPMEQPQMAAPAPVGPQMAAPAPVGPQMAAPAPVGPQMAAPAPVGPQMAAPAPLPPYRALQRGGGGAQQAPGSQFTLPEKPRQRLDMNVVMANAPQDPEAFNVYMSKISPHIDAQDRAEMAAQKQDLALMKAQNDYLLSKERLANAQTPEERAQARAEAARHHREMENLYQQAFGLKKEKAKEEKSKTSVKERMFMDAKAQERQLIGEIRDIVVTHPEVVGLQGAVSRATEAVGGATGATTSTVANDFQRKIRMLQNITKRIEAYGPEGRVLKGELADRDVLVKGLGTFTSAPAVLSNLADLEKYANTPVPGEVITGRGGKLYRYRGGDVNDKNSYEPL